MMINRQNYGSQSSILTQASIKVREAPHQTCHARALIPRNHFFISLVNAVFLLVGWQVCEPYIYIPPSQSVRITTLHDEFIR